MKTAVQLLTAGLTLALVFASSLLRAQTYPVDWDSLQGFQPITGAIVKNVPAGWDNNQALSKNLLAAGSDGWFSYTLPTGFDDHELGFRVLPADLIRFGFRTSGGSLRIIENGILKPLVSFAVQAGDVLKLEKSGQYIIYRLNGSEINRTPLAIQPDFVINCRAYQQGEQIGSIAASFFYPFELAISTSNAWPSRNIPGQVMLKPGGGTAPYQVSADGKPVHQSTVSATTGEHLMEARDANNSLVQQWVKVFGHAAWGRYTGCAQTDSVTVKSTGSTPAAVISYNLLPNDKNGELNYRAYSQNRNTTVGFTNLTDLVNASGILYGFKTQAGTVELIENDGSVALLPYVDGALLTLRKEAGNIIYQVNDLTVRTVPLGTSSDLRLAAVLHDPQAAVGEVLSTFPIPQTALTARVTDAVYGLARSGGVSLEINDPFGNASVIWNNGTEGPAIYGTGQGTLHAVVQNTAGAVQSLDTEVLTDITADGTTETVFQVGGTILTADLPCTSLTPASNLLQAGIDASEVGFVEATFMGGELTLGLSRGIPMDPGTYFYGVEVDDGKLYAYTEGHQAQTSLILDAFGSPVYLQAGDIIRIEKSFAGEQQLLDAVAHIWVNGELVHTEDIENNPPLKVGYTFLSPDAALTRVRGLFTTVDGDPTGPPNENEPTGETPVGCGPTQSMHYIQEISYDEYGRVVSNTVAYSDRLGRTLQTVGRDLEKNITVYNHRLFDAFGRPAVTGLPTPDYKNGLCYKPNQVISASGGSYTWKDFDKFPYEELTASPQPGSVNKPNAVQHTYLNSLGWYYGNSNDKEKFADQSDFPFSQVEYHDNLSDLPRRVTVPGNGMQMGSGHESMQYMMADHGQLQFVMGGNYQGGYAKTVSKAPGNLTSIQFTDLLGNTVATCVSGDSASACSKQVGTAVIAPGRYESVDIHLPQAGKDSVLLSFSNTYLLNYSRFDYRIYDLGANKLLVQDVDYTLTASSTTQNTAFPEQYLLKFLGSYAQGEHFFRIGIQYHDDFWNDRYRGHLPPHYVTYKTDYSYWSLYYYDRHGKLTARITPADVDCQTYNPAIKSFTIRSREQQFAGLKTPNGSYRQGTNLFNITPPAALNPSQQNYEVDVNIMSYAFDPPASLYDLAGTKVSYAVDPNTGRADTAAFCEFARVKDFDPDTIGYEDVYPISETVLGSNTLAASDPYMALGADDLGTPLYYNPRNPIPPGFETEPPQTNDPCGGGYNEHYPKCFNGVKDCKETGIDSGGYCPASACAGVAPVHQATFEVVLSVGYRTNAGTLNFTNAQKLKYTHDLLVNCYCKLLWDQRPASYNNPDNVQTLRFKAAAMPDFKELVVRLDSVNVKGRSDSVFSPVTATDVVEDWAKYIVIKGYQTDFVTPKITAPTHTDTSRFAYDTENRLTQSDLPDEGVTAMRYNELGQLRYSQNSRQKTDGVYSYFIYDRAGRLTETGVYKETGTPFASLTGAMIDSAYNPGPANILEQHTYSYDLPATDIPTLYQPYLGNRYTAGRLVRSGNEHSATWYSYDYQGRVEATLQRTAAGAGVYEYALVAYSYDLYGNPTTITYNGHDLAKRWQHSYGYDRNLRLATVSTRKGEGATLLHSRYYYYDHGPLERTELADTLQGIDYVYTIAGALKSINDPGLDSLRDPGRDGVVCGHPKFAKDVFGMALDYHKNDYTRLGTQVQTWRDTAGTSPDGYFNGLVLAQRWRTQKPAGVTLQHDTGQLIYRYDYDRYNRLSGATFGKIAQKGQQNNQGYANTYAGPMANFLDDYKLGNITYDLNGNIRTMKRQGHSQAGLDMDDLSYTYDLAGKRPNRLVKVANAVTATTYGPEQVKPQASAINYTYDKQGRMLSDQANGLYYTYFEASGLTKTIYSDPEKTKKKEEYRYDERGKRILKTMYNVAGTTPTLRVKYCNDVNGNPIEVVEESWTGTAWTLNTREQYLYGQGRIGSLKDNVYQYELTDHLGNIRAMVSRNETLLSSTDYYPHGSAMPGRSFVSTPSRFSYQGQEKDASGLHAFDLRLYDSKLGRWQTPDPMMQHQSPYLAMSDNPVSFIDPNGGEDEGYNGGWNENHLQLLKAFGWDKGLSAQFSNYEDQARYFQEQAQMGEMATIEQIWKLYQLDAEGNEFNVRYKVQYKILNERQINQAIAGGGGDPKGRIGPLTRVAMQAPTYAYAPVQYPPAVELLRGIISRTLPLVHFIIEINSIDPRMLHMEKPFGKVTRVGKDEMKNLQKNGFDPHQYKPKQGGPGGKIDFWKDLKGNIFWKTEKSLNWEPTFENYFIITGKI